MDTNRKCSQCGNNGHNTRTCNATNTRTCNAAKGWKLFGVRILGEEEEEVMRKSSSMGNLASCAPEQSSGDPGGYLSDGPVHESRKGGHERKRGHLSQSSGKPHQEDHLAQKSVWPASVEPS